jgi:hypothetical protein
VSGGTRIIKASKTVPRPADDAKMGSSAIACFAKKQRVPQTNRITRLIQLESGALFTASKEFVDSSAVMDCGFSRIRASECARGARCRVSQPARVGESSRFSETGKVSFHDERKSTKRAIAMSIKNCDCFWFCGPG